MKKNGVGLVFKEMEENLDVIKITNSEPYLQLSTPVEAVELQTRLQGFTTQVENGFRFIHQMEIQGRIEQSQIAVETSTLIDLLVAKGVISVRELEDRRHLAETFQEKREEGRAFPMLSKAEDKYKIPSPEIPCSELLHICRGACCNLTFNLSIQDLDEGIVEWNYGEPYRIRQDPTSGKCVHFKNGKGCGIYECRPGICRSYDCRQDRRIWKDFENRIPSDNLAKLVPHFV